MKDEVRIMTTEEDKLAFAWAICPECGERHFIFPGKEIPLRYCRDEIRQLKPEQEIEVQYIERDEV